MRDQAMAAFHEANRRWRTRQSEQAELTGWADAPLPHADDSHAMRLRLGERLHETLPATLVEDRTEQGRPTGSRSDSPPLREGHDRR